MKIKTRENVYKNIKGQSWWRLCDITERITAFPKIMIKHRRNFIKRKKSRISRKKISRDKPFPKY